MILGRVDKLSGQLLFGWALDNEKPTEHLTVEIVLGGETIASGTANVFRSDLKASGLGAGDHAFEIELPEPVPENTLSIYVSGSAGRRQLEFSSADEHKFSELYDVIVARYDTLFSSMQQRSQKFEQEFQKTLRHDINERQQEFRKEVQNINDRLDAAEVFLFRLDEAVRKLAEKDAKRRRRLFGLF